MAHGKQHGGIGLYVAVALILGVITFVEFAIVEWPPTFMSSAWVLFWLIALSVVKFWMVIWFFMHLKDDDKLYTGFFSSGMVIAMGTFVALVFLFLLPRAVAPVVAAEASSALHADGGHGKSTALPAAVVANIASDGASRSLAERAGNPRPADRSMAVTPPAAPTNGFEVRIDAAAAEPAADLLAQATAEPVLDLVLGAQVYAANCAGCHQATGAGIPGVFPPLAGHAADLFAAEGGRTYLIDVLLYGLQGPITVDGASYNGIMPAWAQLGDEQIAALSNYLVVGFEGAATPAGFEPIQAGEVAEQRRETLTRAQVLERRNALEEAPAVEPEVSAEEVATEADPTFDRDFAAQVYASNCSACHQPTGAGIPGAFPPLAGHAADLYGAEGGRSYLIDVLLYGLQGPITVNGMNYNGLMPAWAQLSDEQIAALVNHSVAGFAGSDAPEGFDAIRPSEVAAQRGLGLSGPQIAERRAALGLD